MAAAGVIVQVLGASERVGGVCLQENERSHTRAVTLGVTFIWQAEG